MPDDTGVVNVALFKSLFWYIKGLFWRIYFDHISYLSSNGQNGLITYMEVIWHHYVKTLKSKLSAVYLDWCGPVDYRNLLLVSSRWKALVFHQMLIWTLLDPFPSFLTMNKIWSVWYKYVSGLVENRFREHGSPTVVWQKVSKLSFFVLNFQV